MEIRNVAAAAAPVVRAFVPRPTVTTRPVAAERRRDRLGHEHELVGFLDDLLTSRLGDSSSGDAVLMRRGLMIEGVFDLR